MTSDFNGDGFDDVLFRDGAGVIHILQSTGNYFELAEIRDHVGLDWQVAATADFNGDGHDDILWRNVDGGLTDWLGDANSTFVDNFPNSYASVSTDWHIAGVGDFNGDGRADLLWRNTDGRISDWLGTDAGGFSDNVAVAYDNVSTDWHITAIGDFNGDGRDDILWRNADGRMSDWLGTDAGGFSDNVAHSYNNVSTDWQVFGSGDFNGDGRDDIMWQNLREGTFSNWLGTENGGFLDNAVNAYVSQDLADYAFTRTHLLVGLGDYNGDGRADILMRYGGDPYQGVDPTISAPNGGWDWWAWDFQSVLGVPRDWVVEPDHSVVGSF